MKYFNKINTLLILIASVAMPSPAHAESLLEIYQQALQGDPQIHEAEARRLAALEAKPQARGVLLPQISASADWTNNQIDGTNFSYINNATTSFDQDTDNTNWGVNLRQSLFRWDQIVNLKRADKTVARAEAVREAAQQDLIVRVAQRYFDVLAAEDRLTSRNANREAIARQLEQAKQRFDVGLIAITDVQESQAAYDQAVADEIGAKRSLATAREYLREITGQYVAQLDAPGDDFPLINPDNSETSWVDLSLEQNLNLVASRLDEKLARDEISFRKNGYYPSLELVVATNENTSTGEVFSSNPIFGDSTNFPDDSSSLTRVSVQFTMPLFAGGATNSRVKEAVYLHRASASSPEGDQPCRVRSA